MILATSGSDANWESGGGAFGGGGGQSSSLGQGYAGSGTTAGGSSGQTIFTSLGGPGGGGGFNGSGSGGGGAVYLVGRRTGAGVGGAGGGGGASSNGGYGVDGGAGLPPGGFYIGFGNAGEGGGIRGGFVTAGAVAPHAMVAGSVLFGGNGGQGASSDDIGNGAGPANGGAEIDGYIPGIPTPGGPAVPGTYLYGEPRGGSAGSGNEQFGYGGGPAIGPFPANRLSAGSSTSPGVNAGHITINANNTFVNGTVNPKNELFGGGSVLALGTGGSVTITGNLVSAGRVSASSVNIPDIKAGTVPAAISVSSQPVSISTARTMVSIPNFGQPFGTIVSTDQTPEATSVASIENDGKPIQLLGQIAYIGRNFELSDGLGEILTLQNNNNLLFASKDGTVSTPFGTISVAAGSTLIIMQTASEMAVVNLHDEHHGAVVLDLKGKKVELPIGRQLIITSDKTANFDKVNISRIGYRDLKEISLENGKVFLSEISLPSALSMIDKSTGKDKNVRRLQKTAAAMWVMGQSQGKSPFKVSE